MASILYKWLLGFVVLGIQQKSPEQANLHPFFISVTQIEHNATDQSLEISCKLFTDDFEKALRQTNTIKIDLLKKEYSTTMNPVVNAYIQKHLSFTVDGKKVAYRLIGFEQQQDAIVSYFEAADVKTCQKITVTNSILYDYKTEQTNIIHVTEKGNRKSSKLTNPDETVSFSF